MIYNQTVQLVIFSFLLNAQKICSIRAFGWCTVRLFQLVSAYSLSQNTIKLFKTIRNLLHKAPAERHQCYLELCGDWRYWLEKCHITWPLFRLIMRIEFCRGRASFPGVVKLMFLPLMNQNLIWKLNFVDLSGTQKLPVTEMTMDTWNLHLQDWFHRQDTQ